MTDIQAAKPNRSRMVFIVLTAVIVAGLLIWALMPQPIPVDLVTLERGTMTVSVKDEGKTRVVDVYTVSAPLDGRVLRIEAEVGDPVSAYKTVIASIEPTSPDFLNVRTRAQAESAVKASEATQSLAAAELGRADAELDFALAELKRAEALAARGNISNAALDRARLNVSTREAALETARAALRVRDFELERARASLIDPGSQSQGNGQAPENPEDCCVPVFAPVDGRILAILHESEGVLSAGTPLVDIGDPRDLEIVVDLLSDDAVKVVPGAVAQIEDWGGPGPLAGKVKRVEPVGFTKISALGIEEQRVNVIVDLTDPPDQWTALGHGYRVETNIVTWQDDAVLTLPLGALFRDGQQWAVFVNDGGRARLAAIEIGQTNQRAVEVLSGLEDGDQVILHPSDRIADDVRIEARDEA